MGELFASGRIVDLVLGLTVCEALLVLGWHGRTGRGVPPADFLPNLLSGICLMLALRAALVGAAWIWIALGLVAALAAHLIDLHRRWQR
jgi:hypothetical protein